MREISKISGYRIYRYEKCRKCGRVWQVSKNKVLPKKGYICPSCTPLRRKKGGY